MNEYSIYCTPEQTKKALELGAPIEFEVECPVNLETLERPPYPEIKMGKDGEPILIIPTAEQMIGWLEEQSMIERVDIFCLTSWGYMIIRDDLVHPYICVSKNENEGFSSRKEATLAVIDAALEYLSNNK